MDFDKLVARINELYRKSKTVGLTESERSEQQKLRMEYRQSVLGNFTSQLDSMKIQNIDGSIENVRDRKKQ